MSSYVLQNPELDTDIYYLNLPARAYNGLRHDGINTIRKFVLCSEEELSNIRNLGEKSVKDILTMQKKVQAVLDNNADMTDSENYLIFCALNRSKVICYFASYCEQSISDLPFSTNLINRLYFAGYRKLSQIVLNIPVESDGPMWGSIEKISSVSRYYLREEKAGILEYLNCQSENRASIKNDYDAAKDLKVADVEASASVELNKTSFAHCQSQSVK